MKKSVTRIAKSFGAGATKGGFEAAGRETLEVVGGAARQIWLAGLGAAATAGEAGVAAFDALVEKGKRRRETPVEKLSRTLTNGSREAARFFESNGRAVYRQATGLLNDLGLPVESEIRALSARIDALRAKLG